MSEQQTPSKPSQSLESSTLERAPETATRITFRPCTQSSQASSEPASESFTPSSASRTPPFPGAHPASSSTNVMRNKHHWHTGINVIINYPPLQYATANHKRHTSRASTMAPNARCTMLALINHTPRAFSSG